MKTALALTGSRRYLPWSRQPPLANVGVASFLLAALLGFPGCSTNGDAVDAVPEPDLGYFANAPYWEAEELLTNSHLQRSEKTKLCMEAEGWQYWLVDSSEGHAYAKRMASLVEGGDAGVEGAKPLSVSDAFRVVVEEGLHRPPEISSGSQQNRDYARGLDLSAQQQYAEDIATCTADDDESLALWNLFDQAGEIRYDAEERAFASVDLAKIVNEWKWCVADQGVDPVPSSPLDLREFLIDLGFSSVTFRGADEAELRSQIDAFAATENEILSAVKACGHDEALRSLEAEVQHQVDLLVAEAEG